MKFKVSDLARARADCFPADGSGMGWVKPGSVFPIQYVEPLDGRVCGLNPTSKDCHPIRIAFFTYPEGQFHCGCQFDHVEDDNLAIVRKALEDVRASVAR